MPATTHLLRATTRLPLLPSSSRLVQRSLFSTTSHTSSSSPFATGPAPPRLPEEEQKVFEELQKASTGAFSTPREATPSSQTSTRPPRPVVNQSPQATAETTTNATGEEQPKVLIAQVKATGKGDELHPDVRRGAKPEFEGDRNPKTGEIGGPKNDPLRWGGTVDWSYNGRVTDF